MKKRGLPRLLISAPFIYGMIIPAVLLHISLCIYQHTAFRLYGIPRIPAKKYIKDARRFLSYLNWLEKINCWYCTYVNGVFALATAVAHETEKMWCPIQNAKERMEFDLPHRKEFAEYNNDESLKEYLRK